MPSRGAESLGAARAFDRRSASYRAVGLCDRCAPAAAYAHTGDAPGGPCNECAPVVSELPRPLAGAWRGLTAA